MNAPTELKVVVQPDAPATGGCADPACGCGRRKLAPNAERALKPLDARPVRTLKMHVLRYNPHEAGSRPHLQTFTLQEADGMTLYMALSEVRETQDPSLQFDFVCRAGICGSCAMLINGKPGLACRTLTQNLGEEFTLAPLPFFQLIGDLSVDTGKWMRTMSERVEAWVHVKQHEVDLTRIEARMEPELAEKIYELDRCVECGCCVAACGTARMREDFVGAVALGKIARFRMDPRDERSDADFYEIVGDDQGIFGCMSLLACHDVCPKNLPLATQLAYLRRQMLRQGLQGEAAEPAPVPVHFTPRSLT